MKNIILSADGDSVVYSVPDAVADHLDAFCLEFCGTWLYTSPHAAKYRTCGGVCYNETDFIEYLNRWIFPDKRSSLVENLGWLDSDDALPEKYRDCPRFRF